MAEIAPSTADHIPRDSKAIRQCGLDHLKQLDSLAVENLHVFPGRPQFDLDSDYQQLVNWTSANTANIQQALQNRVNGGQQGSPINWQNVLMTFLESAAVYLRDDATLLRAVEAYRKGEIEKALQLYQDSTATINKLANLWGMQFVQLCDLLSAHPVGHQNWVGPYCGAFFTNNTFAASPSLGIAFKGTKMTSLSQWIVDWNFQPIKGTEFLTGLDISQGIYAGLFQNSAPNDPVIALVKAFDIIRSSLPSIAVPNTTGASTPIHVTGHSLGASYATLCYLALLQNPTGENLALGDIVTFGSPRVGLASLTDTYSADLSTTTQSQQSWRICNNVDGLLFGYIQDPVTQVPPILGVSPGPPETVFQHIDSGYMVYPDQDPTAMASEIGTSPSKYYPTGDPYRTGEAHMTSSYYNSLYYALTGTTNPAAILAKAEAEAEAKASSTAVTTEVEAAPAV